ncbi:hypothetical protein, partial [Salmonella sp. s51228]|uniref:hypothetical protein n=1 Tax=Salmonella sp. s51228 TaxID=3159652 RepID=UPI0039818A82
MVIQKNITAVGECIDGLINTIESRTNYKVFVEETRAHVDIQTTTINNDATDVIIYALDASQGVTYPVIISEDLIK